MIVQCACLNSKVYCTRVKNWFQSQQTQNLADASASAESTTSASEEGQDEDGMWSLHVVCSVLMAPVLPVYSSCREGDESILKAS